MISEFYMLRRTAIKDIAAYLGFLAGFIGSAPFAWGLLAQQLEAGRFARGLWYFFGIVTAGGIFAGVAGLGIGIAAGMLWEIVHRHRRGLKGMSVAGRVDAVVPRVVNSEIPSIRPDAPARLQLVPQTPASPQPAMDFKALKTASLRDLVLAVIVIGELGLITELALLDHTDSWKQWIPLVVLVAGLVSTILVRWKPGRGTLFGFRCMMVMFLAAGVLGLYFHYEGNVEFALERTPSLGRLALLWKALRGATPTLAPGALAQLGLLGLAYAYRHPSVNRPEEGHKGDER
jgi:hypothetical protein